MFVRNVRSTTSVLQLPMRSQITFGGAPRRIANSDVAVRLCEQPQLRIVRAAEIEQTCLGAARVEIGQPRDELVGNVVVKEQLHA